MNGRALFITFDSPHIDRRILLFARAFKELGLQPAILTPYGETEKGFEDIEIVNLCSHSKGAGTVIAVKEFLRTRAPSSVFNIARRIYKSLFYGILMWSKRMTLLKI